MVRSSAAVVLLALASSSTVLADSLTEPCRVADEYLGLAGKLDRAAARLKDRDPFRILVVGSSSTAGVGATSPAKAYTERLEEELEHRLAGVEVDVVARGVGGETAIGAEARLAKELGATKPDLVIWQIGTNDVYRKVDLSTFRATAERGLRDIAAAGVDAALLDPQYVPQDEALYAPYVGALEQLSVATGVPLARRFAAMRAVAKAGGGGVISRDRLHMNDTGHACVGAFLAEALDRKLAPTPPAIAEAHRPT
ncbi:SGNH/GDSL hydrolase family protein [Hansschlegelia zhihuaiae]|uniref:SGNH/GDSL hydrolase family protein n=1 Tax=Hansschlegelia zhihuaiae TaxID=405005 RepID=UPI001FE0759E|nr:SGNH/GDSL hydrolase family protein [Hansschlegelia zhihuaiae]